MPDIYHQASITLAFVVFDESPPPKLRGMTIRAWQVETEGMPGGVVPFPSDWNEYREIRCVFIPKTKVESMPNGSLIRERSPLAEKTHRAVIQAH